MNITLTTLVTKLKPIIRMESKTIDISELQWYDQIKLDHVFNL